MIFGYLAGPGAHFGGPGSHSGGSGPHFEDFRDCCDFWGTPATKVESNLETILNKFSTFAVLFFDVFSSACFSFFFVVILSAPRLHFGYHLDSFLGALGLSKNSPNCDTVIIFKGVAPSRRNHFARIDCGCVLIVSFSVFFDFQLF